MRKGCERLYLPQKVITLQCTDNKAFVSQRPVKTEAEFFDLVGTTVLRVFLLAIHSHLYKRILPPLPFEQKWFESGL